MGRDLNPIFASPAYIILIRGIPSAMVFCVAQNRIAMRSFELKKKFLKVRPLAKKAMTRNVMWNMITTNMVRITVPMAMP